jgi:hypothetical protein
MQVRILAWNKPSLFNLMAKFEERFNEYFKEVIIVGVAMFGILLLGAMVTWCCVAMD